MSSKNKAFLAGVAVGLIVHYGFMRAQSRTA